MHSVEQTFRIYIIFNEKTLLQTLLFLSLKSSKVLSASLSYQLTPIMMSLWFCVLFRVRTETMINSKHYLIKLAHHIMYHIAVSKKPDA